MTASITARTTTGELLDEKPRRMPSRRSTTTRRRESGRPRRRRETSTWIKPEPAMAPPVGHHENRVSQEQTGETGQIRLANPGDAVRWGKLAGARAILVGTINQIRTETKSFQGYGVATARTIVSAEVRVRIIDLESGQVQLSKTVTGAADKLDTEFAQSGDTDLAYSIVRDAIEKLAEDKDFLAFIKGRPAK